MTLIHFFFRFLFAILERIWFFTYIATNHYGGKFWETIMLSFLYFLWSILAEHVGVQKHIGFSFFL